MKVIILYLAVIFSWLTLVLHLAHGQGLFEIYPDSGLFNQFDTHVETERHYHHCAKENEILRAEVLVTEWENQSLRLENSKCSEDPEPLPCAIEEFENGRLWKPGSESTGRVAVLLEGELCGANPPLRILSQETFQEVASARFRRCTNPNRPTYDLSKSAAEIAAIGPVFVEFEKNGRSVCLAVDNPNQRYE